MPKTISINNGNGTLRKAGMIVSLVIFFAMVCGTAIATVSALIDVKDTQKIEIDGKFNIVDRRLDTLEENVDSNECLARRVDEKLQTVTLQLQRISIKLGVDQGN